METIIIWKLHKTILTEINQWTTKHSHNSSCNLLWDFEPNNIKQTYSFCIAKLPNGDKDELFRLHWMSTKKIGKEEIRIEVDMETERVSIWGTNIEGTQLFSPEEHDEVLKYLSQIVESIKP